MITLEFYYNINYRLSIFIICLNNYAYLYLQSKYSARSARYLGMIFINKPISISYLKQGYRWNITKFNLKVEF